MEHLFYEHEHHPNQRKNNQELCNEKEYPPLKLQGKLGN